MYSHLICGEQRGRQWTFWADESPAVQLASPGRASYRDLAAGVEGQVSPWAFEDLARGVMSQHFGIPLAPGQLPGVPKEWDMVSPKGDIMQSGHAPSPLGMSLTSCHCESKDVAKPYAELDNGGRVDKILDRY